MIPLFVDLAERRVIIFGGGEVAARKARYFSGEADVTVISRSHSKAVSKLPITCTTLDLADVSDEHLADLVDDAFIVIAALSDKGQNNRIGRICRQKKVLFNNADGEAGDLIIPAVASGKRYKIAVSTSGKSPAVSRFIREHLESTFTRLDEMIDLQDMLRRELKRSQPSRERRTEVLRKVARDQDIWNALSTSPEEAEDLARRRYLHE